MDAGRAAYRARSAVAQPCYLRVRPPRRTRPDAQSAASNPQSPPRRDAALAGRSRRASSAGAGEPVASLRLGTATPGDGFQLFGQHLAEAIDASDADLRILPVATRGSAQNLSLLQSGEVDLGLVEGNAARQALQGLGGAPAGLRVPCVMYPNPGMFVVRADSPVRRIEDLAGRRISLGTQASGLRILGSEVLEGIGLTPGRDLEDLPLEKAGDGPRLVLSGEIDALWGAGIGWPGFLAVAEDPAGARFVGPSPEQIERIRARHPQLRPMAIPAGTYRGQTLTIDSVGLWSLILVRSDLPEGLAYRLARTLHQSETALAARLDQGRYSTAINTAAEVPAAQLHPGVARYLREAGLTP